MERPKQRYQNHLQASDTAGFTDGGLDRLCPSRGRIGLRVQSMKRRRTTYATRTAAPWTIILVTVLLLFLITDSSSLRGAEAIAIPAPESTTGDDDSQGSGMLPLFLYEEEGVIRVLQGERLLIDCTAISLDPILYRITDNGGEVHDKQFVDINSVTFSESGNWTCSASNTYGVSTLVFVVEVINDTSGSATLPAMVGLGDDDTSSDWIIGQGHINSRFPNGHHITPQQESSPKVQYTTLGLVAYSLIGLSVILLILALVFRRNRLLGCCEETVDWPEPSLDDTQRYIPRKRDAETDMATSV
ncbi:uncharacterized protein LOC135823819 [Sycon ciliatum]|uniref:uncharacterized protein LOC135823819 n=1 Tax=Sycon ciliatum TaxID=27933 RepID=UPI0031F6F9F2